MYVLLMFMKPEILIEASGCIIDMPHRKCELLDMDRKPQMSSCQRHEKDPKAVEMMECFVFLGVLKSLCTLAAGIRRMFFSISCLLDEYAISPFL